MGSLDGGPLSAEPSCCIMLATYSSCDTAGTTVMRSNGLGCGSSPSGSSPRGSSSAHAYSTSFVSGGAESAGGCSMRGGVGVRGIGTVLRCLGHDTLEH